MAARLAAVTVLRCTRGQRLFSEGVPSIGDHVLGSPSSFSHWRASVSPSVKWAWRPASQVVAWIQEMMWWWAGLRAGVGKPTPPGGILSSASLPLTVQAVLTLPCSPAIAVQSCTHSLPSLFFPSFLCPLPLLSSLLS